MTTESLLNTNDNWVPSQYLATWQKKPFQACKPSRYFPFLSNQLGCSELCQVKSPVSSTGVGRHTEGPTLFSTERKLLCVLLALLKARTAVPLGNLHSHSSDCCALCGSRQPIATQLRDDGIKGAQNQHLVWNTWKIKDRSFPPGRDKDSHPWHVTSMVVVHTGHPDPEGYRSRPSWAHSRCSGNTRQADTLPSATNAPLDGPANHWFCLTKPATRVCC